MIKFQGLLGSTFGGFPTIRGIAKFSDIKNLSEPKNYQRETISKHLTEIGNYYENGENLFFSEIILSLELKYDFDKPGSTSGINPIQDILHGRSFVSNVNNIKIKPLAQRHENDKLRITNVIIKNDIEKVFGRIDGNHRLTAENNENILNEEIPFCIVLFDAERIKRQEKMLFFNINSKAIPLTTEETLISIFTDDINFNNETLKNNSSFGWEYCFSKQIKQDDIDTYFTNISTLFDGTFSTTFLKLFKILLDNAVIQKQENEITKVREALSYINTHIYNENVLKDSKNTSVFSAFLYYQLKSSNLIKFITKWVLKNEIYKINELEPESIIKIMDSIASHRIKNIFVAMPYWSHDRVTEYNKLFKEALDELELTLDLPFKLNLYPIMRHRGESTRIDEQLLNQIRECDIFIADLTEANVNVIYETAFAEGLRIPSLLIKDEDDSVELPFDMDKRLYKPYKSTSYYTQIKGIVKYNLKVILNDN